MTPGKKFLVTIFAPIAIVGGGNLWLMSPRPDPQGAFDTVSKTTNLHDVKIDPKGPWAGCGGHADFWRTRFSGINDRGQTVKGIVCKGLGTSSTIRYE